MTATRYRWAGLLLIVATVAGGGSFPAQAPGATGAPGPVESGQGAVSPAQRYFTDVELVNQRGEPMRLYSDLLKGKVVVINTIFTTCTSICPLMSKTYAKIQEHVGDRLGRDVFLISISVDPENDTPELLKKFGESYDARPGWFMLTGSSENVHLALRKLGHDVDQKESHKAIILIGNEPTGLWKKAFGLAPAEDIITILDSVIRDELELAPGGSPGG
jgi:protein SCO1/2